MRYSLSMSSTLQTMKPVIISKTCLLLSRSYYSRLIGPGAQVQTPPHIPTFSHPESLWGPVPTSGDGTDVWPSSGPPPLPPGPPPGKAVCKSQNFYEARYDGWGRGGRTERVGESHGRNGWRGDGASE